MPNTTARPWKMFLPLAVVLLLALLWTIYWFTASGIARERFAEERAKLEAQGMTLACTDEAWGGFPFHFEFNCTSPVLTYAKKAELRSQHLLLVALAYAPWQVVALLDGPTTVLGEGLEPTQATHDRIIAAVTFGRDWQPQVSAEIPALEVRGVMKAQRVMANSRPSATGGTDLALSAQNVSYEPPGKPPVAIDEGSALGTLLPDQSLKIDSVELRQGRLNCRGSGTLSLDAQRRPEGRIDAETNDVDDLLTVLTPYLPLDDKQKDGLKAMLSLLGNEAKAPIIARDGALYIGPFRIGEVRPLY